MVESGCGPSPFKTGYCLGWEAATRFFANALQLHARLGGMNQHCFGCLTCIEPVIDDADRHMWRLEQWRDQNPVTDTAPPEIPVDA